MDINQTLDYTKSTSNSSDMESCIAESNSNLLVALIPPDDFNLNDDALPENQRVNAPGAEIQNSPVLLSYALRKNGSTEVDVYSTIYTCILPADRINSNYVSGGIAHANAKGILPFTITYKQFSGFTTNS